MITTNKSINLLLGKKISRTASATATDPSASTYIVDGETVVTTVGGVVLNSSTVNTNADALQNGIVVVQSQGATKPPIKSDIIRRANVTAYKAKVAVTAVEQVTYIGYDGTTSTLKIDAVSNNQYIGRILMQGEQNTFGNRDMYKNFDFMSDSTATQAEIAEGLQQSLINNFSKMPDRYAKFEMVNAATFSASTGATGTATFTYGSNVITTSGATPATDFPAGSFVRIGTTATSTLTLPVYEVASVSNSAQTITLTVPYQGASGTGATTAFAFATAATAIASNFGIKITGVAKTYSVGKFRYYKNRFKVLLTDNFGVTSVTYTTGASEGSGTTEQIQDLEWLLQDGNIYRVSVPPFVERANAITYLAAGSGTGWSQVSVEFSTNEPGGVGNTQASRKQLIVAAVTTTNSAAGGIGTNMEGAVTSVMDVLDSHLSTAIAGTGGPFPTQLGIC